MDCQILREHLSLPLREQADLSYCTNLSMYHESIADYTTYNISVLSKVFIA